MKINGAPAQKRGKRDKESASHWMGGSCEIGASRLAGAVAKREGVKGATDDTRVATQIVVKTRELREKDFVRP